MPWVVREWVRARRFYPDGRRTEIRDAVITWRDGPPRDNEQVISGEAVNDIVRGRKA